MDNELLPAKLPEIEVVEKGETKTYPAQARPDVMAFLMQASMNAQLVRMRRLEESKVPTGIRQMELNVTESGIRLWLDPPWIAFTLTNTGPDGVKFDVNEERLIYSEAPVEKDETVNVDMHYPIIRRLYLVTEADESATVRIYATKGRSDVD